MSQGSWIFQAVGVYLALSISASAQFAPGSSPTFPSPNPFPFPVGNSPSSIVSGNFNADSIPDLAVANELDGTVTLILSNGKGGFAAAGPYKVGKYPVSMALLGIDHNNNQELAVVNQGDSTLTILLFGLNGTLTATQGPFPVGSSPTSVAVGIFRMGGNLDLAIANRDSNSVTVLKGDGLGNFTPYPGSPFAVGNGPSSVVVADFNLDGNMDIAVTNEFDNTVTLLLGDGGGGFSQAPTSPFVVGSNPDYAVTADFNGDGNPDLAIANMTSNNVTVLLGNGAGVFTAAPGGSVAAGTKPVSMAVADFNEDLIPDLAIADFGSANVTVLLGNGMGGFKAGPGSPFTVGNNPSSVAVGDFNGDGTPDLAIANSKDDNVSVLLNSLAVTPVMVNNASYSATAPVAQGSIVSIFGTNLSSLLPVNATAAPPTCLASIVVTLTDAAGLQNVLPLWYVSATQIDAQIPRNGSRYGQFYGLSFYEVRGRRDWRPPDQHFPERVGNGGNSGAGLVYNKRSRQRCSYGVCIRSGVRYHG